MPTQLEGYRKALKCTDGFAQLILGPQIRDRDPGALADQVPGDA